MPDIISIRQLQGDELYSTYNAVVITTIGVVTAVVRRGFFLQTPDKEWDKIGSDGIFVFSRDWRPQQGALLELSGECIDYVSAENAKPVTQILFQSATVIEEKNPNIRAINLSSLDLSVDAVDLAKLLNSLEGMLLEIDAGQTFIAPSNKFGDYVIALDSQKTDTRNLRTALGGMLANHNGKEQWLPSFRMVNYAEAKRLNVGATLSCAIVGPLNYRANAYQLAISSPFEHSPSEVVKTKSRFTSSPNALTIMTLNCFNLDPKVELAHLVNNARTDIDDDVGEGRFHSLARAVVEEANCPDIIALQEIQDNDGAQLSETTDASTTYTVLIDKIKKLSGISYQWVDIPPELGQDGGQPGGNIRNGFLYNPLRALPDKSSLKVLGENANCYKDSRKPLICDFEETASGKRLSVMNVHLASKRHQASIFAPQNPGVDGKLDIRVQQACIIQKQAERWLEEGADYYLTGDFNDTEYSDTLKVLTATTGTNLVMTLAPVQRYDYNHRGLLQVLMHGIVPKTLVAQERAEYEIIHGNELIGVMPGEDSDKPSDHAYVIAKILMK